MMLCNKIVNEIMIFSVHDLYLCAMQGVRYIPYQANVKPRSVKFPKESMVAIRRTSQQPYFP